MPELPPKLPPALLQQVDAKAGIVQIISGKTALGEDFYAYVSIKPSLYEEFCRKVNTGERLDVDTFGKVLHKGFGTEPSEDVKQFMFDKYGIDPNFGDRLAEAVEEALEKRNPSKK